MVARIAAISMLFSVTVLAGVPQVVPLYPKFDPVTVSQEKISNRPDIGQVISNVVYPTITPYLLPDAKEPAPAMIICPGGGYGAVAIDLEGHNVAKRFNTFGMAGIVLKYRMPHFDPAHPDEKPMPLQDAQEALRMVRARAKEWNIDPKRVGIMGFSAGGHLASTVATHFDSPETRPDFAVLVYPVITFKDPVAHGGSRNNLIGKTPDAKLVELYSNELHVTDKTPPTFLVHAKDDGVKVANSMIFNEACKKAGVASELLLFEKGGHGFGLGIHGGEPAAWPGKCAQWMKGRNILP